MDCNVILNAATCENAHSIRGHTLDAVIARKTDKIVSCQDVTDPGLFDKSRKILDYVIILQ